MRLNRHHIPQFGYFSLVLFFTALQAMADVSGLNMGKNIRMRDTQFCGMFLPKTLENQVKCIVLCFCLEH
jgi:hypothetical protein